VVGSIIEPKKKCNITHKRIINKREKFQERIMSLHTVLSGLVSSNVAVKVSSSVTEASYFRRGVDTAHDLLLQDFLGAQAELEGAKNPAVLKKAYEKVIVGSARIIAYLDETANTTSNTVSNVVTTTVEATIPVANVEVANVVTLNTVANTVPLA